MLQHSHRQLQLQPTSCAGSTRGYASWIGDFGHLEGPRFSKQQGKAWQAHMRSQRDRPNNSFQPPRATADVGHSPILKQVVSLLGMSLHQGGSMMQCSATLVHGPV